MEDEFAGHFMPLQFPRNIPLTNIVIDIFARSEHCVEKYFRNINFISYKNMCDMLSYTYNISAPAKIADELIAKLGAKIRMYPDHPSCLMCYIEHTYYRYFDQKFDVNKYNYRKIEWYTPYKDIPRQLIHIN